MVEKLTSTVVFQRLCRAEKKWGMYISFCTDDWNQLIQAAPYLSLEDDIQLTIEGRAVLLFDTEAEMCHYYASTVGDDGPTNLNPYNGPVKVYALTCDPTGQTLSENT